uniref:ribonuclease H n=1 Tax=viral metagenome TaxID=1070528 RepID=A0A6C0HYG4_9ZZZZ
MLLPIYDSDNFHIEIGIDEAGRGPLFGRLYVAAVILPKIEIDQQNIATKKIINWNSIKDSKKIKSKEKMKLCAEFIQKNVLAYSVKYIEHDRIDEINIRQCVFEGMHECIRDIISQLKDSPKNMFLLIDGNDFKPFRTYIQETSEIFTLPYKTIEGGDNKYLAIAAASILAKYSRDTYIEELCQQNKYLDENYGINNNMGYGTKQHLEGIVKYGITQWHRKTYGICKKSELCQI